MYIDLLKKFVPSAGKKAEEFTNVSGNEGLWVVIDVCILVLLLWLGQWLYNNVLCKTLSILKPLPSLWHFLGLLVVLSMLGIRCNC